ncbi:MAG: endolytic transglycosylase MltG [Alphaproteobacteria bacterium]|nr:endolytic transglycosylase MltG [Alphaproteobacteria bacterium]MBN2675122.1 endolytic transglycosylase MltG [Alphaproteobacteria bacterium]
MKKKLQHKNTKSKVKSGKAKIAKTKTTKKVKYIKSVMHGFSLFKNNIFKIAAIIFALVMLLFAYFVAIQSYVKENTFYTVEHGQTISAVASQMKFSNFINSEDLFKVSVLLMGGKIQSGEYELKPGNSVWRIAKMMRSGDIASTVVLIPEGMTVKQIKNLLMNIPTLKGGIECEKTEIKSDKLEPKAVCNLKEGDLFPDTYRVARGISRLDVLELSRKKMDSIRIGWENSGRSMPTPLKSWDEVITLASIIQKETPKDKEMSTVASVYLNRLRKTMKLQADPTIVYVITHGLGDMKGRGLFSSHLKTKSPYNTYINFGLPPAPIANVGRNAIAAVLNPADTNYLFFVADGQGGHKFAKSYEEHKKNQADWREIKKALYQKNK